MWCPKVSAFTVPHLSLIVFFLGTVLFILIGTVLYTFDHQLIYIVECLELGVMVKPGYKAVTVTVGQHVMAEDLKAKMSLKSVSAVVGKLIEDRHTRLVGK